MAVYTQAPLPLIPSEDETIRALHATGMLYKDIAERIGRSTSYVRNYCSRAKLSRQSRWTDAEVETLRAWLAQRIGEPAEHEALAALLGRSRMAIQLKASELGLVDAARPKIATSMRRPQRARKPKARPWSPDEDQFIRGNFLRLSVRDMAKRLGRTLAATYSRKHQLGCITDQRKEEARTCKQCGASFVVQPSSPRKFCSLACAYANPERIVERPIDRGARTCAGCGTVFRLRTHTKNNRFCSQACATRSQRKDESRTCTHCGAIFVVNCKSQRRCCSAECRKARWDESRRRMWSDEGYRQRMSDLTSQRHRDAPAETPRYSNRKDGRRDDLGGMYFRSAWEANIARYLNWLQEQGEIHRWEYEADTFWFEQIKRGVRSYKPDFKIWDTPDSEPYYWEVKGYDYPRGQTARKRMAKYFPNVKLILIDKDAYRAIAKWKGLIPEWEGR